MSQLISAFQKYFYPSAITSHSEPLNLTNPSDLESEELTPIVSNSTLKACTVCSKELNNCFRSQIDHEKEINLDIWAVSILIEKGSSKIADIFSHHTILVIEGFSLQGKFWRKAHLTGAGTLRNREAISNCFSGHSNIGQVQLTDEKYSFFDVKKYKEYRETWIKSREKVNIILQQISWEHDHPDSTPFRLLGENSFAAFQIEFIDTRHPDLIEIEKKDPEKFKSLKILYENADIINNKTQWLLKKTSLGGKISIAAILGVPLSIHLGFIKKYGSHVLPKWPIAEMSIFVCLGLCFLINRDNLKINANHISDGIKKHQEEMELFQNKAKVSIITSQNCFNWARKNLKDLDIELAEEKSFERLIAIPELYLPCTKDKP